jgi:hypothetical protein
MPLPGGPMRPDEAAAIDAVAAALRTATARIEDALDHYQIGDDTMAWGLPVDWEHVARRMAEALGRAPGSPAGHSAAGGAGEDHPGHPGHQERRRKP